jgi:hypothetical protein
MRKQVIANSIFSVQKINIQIVKFAFNKHFVDTTHLPPPSPFSTKSKYQKRPFLVFMSGG